uniref:Uncharacterized protein n=1 Tax=viral metagenome TaxID=1070528 RepID=A0A6C0DJF7_9ZZZZ
MKIIFFNHAKKQCGVYQYGKRVYDILKKTEGVDYIYIEVENQSQYIESILNNAPNIHCIIYNYHSSTMSWLNSTNIQKNVKNIGIPHESDGHFFDIICDIDPNIQETNRKFSIPRPIYDNVDEILENYKPTTQTIKDFIEYSEEGVPIFGSFGFGFSFKGFDKIINIVNEQFDSAIIKFIIPSADFDGIGDITNSNIKNLCESIPKKSKIKLMITHEFCSNEDILYFLRLNTMNIFLYDKLQGRGISSVIDYAISVKKPFGISDSNMFRHIYSDKICLYKNSVNDCMNYSMNVNNKFIQEYSNNNLIHKIKQITKMRGIFYNSKEALCSIWESGKMVYNSLKTSSHYTLDYSEEQELDFSYDFAIFNQHFTVNNWMNEYIIRKFSKPTFCIVTEVSFSQNPTSRSPDYFSHYIVLDPTINETENIHAFCRPLEDFDLSNVDESLTQNDIPKVFSFGFATPGKDWYRIAKLVQNDYDKAFIHFNIPKGTHISDSTHNEEINKIKAGIKSILKKPGINIKITSDNYSKEELIAICSTKTINCFFYNRQHIYSSGLSAVTDQAISSGRPLFITNDCTFRHIHKYIDCYPSIGIKEAIEKTKDGVLKMKLDWSSKNFSNKFEKILIKSFYG